MRVRRDFVVWAAAVVGIAAWNLVYWWNAERSWLDDAWISFRYAQALSAGHGFVYNVEDGPLEGFTNLAWVLLAAGALELGAAPEYFTRFLGLASHVAAVALVASLGWRRGTRSDAAKVGAVVLAALPGATHGLLGIAGSGLETAFAALLLVLLAELVERPRAGAVVAVGVLLCMTRPDGLLFVACALGVWGLHVLGPRVVALVRRPASTSSVSPAAGASARAVDASSSHAERRDVVAPSVVMHGRRIDAHLEWLGSVVSPAMTHAHAVDAHSERPDSVASSAVTHARAVDAYSERTDSIVSPAVTHAHALDAHSERTDSGVSPAMTHAHAIDAYSERPDSVASSAVTHAHAVDARSVRPDSVASSAVTHAHAVDAYSEQTDSVISPAMTHARAVDASSSVAQPVDPSIARRRTRRRFEVGRRAWLLATLGIALGVAALYAWRWFTFHSLVPNTWFAKSAGFPAWDAGWAFWGGFAQSEPGVVGAALLLLLLGWRSPRTSLFAGLSLAAYVVYVAKVGGDFMEYRFAHQVVPLLAWSTARALVEVRAPQLRVAAVGTASACLGFAVLPMKYEGHFGMASLDHMNFLVGEGRSIGARLKEVLPPDTRLATTLAGTLPYEWGGFVVDEWGLTDAYVGRQPDIPVKARGHVKFAPLEYLRRREVHLVVDHPTVCSCAQGCEMPWPQVYVRLEGDRCLRTRYLTQTPALTALFCRDPRFVVRHVDCAPSPPPAWLRGRRRPPPHAMAHPRPRNTPSVRRRQGRAPVDDSGPEPSTPNASATSVRRRLGREPDAGIEPAPARSWRAVDVAAFLAKRRGVAFGPGPVRGALAGQQPVSGFRTNLINSFHGGDESSGWLEWAPPPGTRALRGRVGGGADCTRVFLGVLHEGRVVARVCGTDSETLKPFELALPEGARVVLADTATGGWGHILVSDLETAP